MAGDIRSELAVPLMRENGVWGVLNVESSVPNAFKQDDLRLLETIGDHIMMPLQNAEVHQNLLQEQTRRIALEDLSNS